VLQGTKINVKYSLSKYCHIPKHTLRRPMIAQNPTKDKIYVICDNARYYKNKELTEKISNSKIK
jgi:hypothetical protein